MREPVARWFYAAAIADTPLPSGAPARAAFVRWAQRGHILGQVAAAIGAGPDGAGGQPGKLGGILENARVRSNHDRRMLSFEAERIHRALMGTGIRPILLKGGAYVAAHLPAGLGRRVSDIDILVEEKDLERVEKRLTEAGWMVEPSTADPYDQHYYRAWMHELPPLRHKGRRTLIDVHHRLLPRTARVRPDHIPMMAAAVPVEGGRLLAFGAPDRFIHSAIHIFADGAFETPARSLIELAYLFRDLDEKEWETLIARAEMLGVGAPVVAALWAVAQFFGDERAAGLLAGRRPGLVLRWCVTAAALDRRSVPLARLMLYLRSHYLRMPLPHLLRHLIRKALRRA
jgi:hypothetical protein